MTDAPEEQAVLGAGSPAHKRYPVWWTGDRVPLYASVESMVDEAVHDFRAFVHSDCGGHGDRTFIASYQGSDAGQRAKTGTASYDCAITLFGDPSAASVYIGLGLEDGKIAVCGQPAAMIFPP